MIKLTLVTITYNHEKYIKQALDSFIMQKTNFDFEIVVADDCSTDNTRKIILEYAEKYPNKIKPIFNKINLGSLKNFVTTLSKVNTEYVAICDGDDYFTDENKLQKQVDFLDNNKDFTICCHPTRIFFENKEHLESIWPINFESETTLEDLLKENYIMTNSVVYRWIFKNKNNLEEIFPDNIVPGDYYIHLLHAKLGKIKLLPDVMADYRRHEGGIWWLNATPEGKEQFSIVYGERFVNFYNEVEKKFKLDKNFFLLQKKDLIYNAIRSFTKNNSFDKLENIMINNREIFNVCMKEIVERNDEYIKIISNPRPAISDEFYWSLPKIKKIPYLLFIDRKRLRKLINTKFRIFLKKH